MLTRTHFVFNVFVFLVFFPYLDFLNRGLFFVLFFVGTFLPDIDSSSSKIGKSIFLRPLQWIVRHRGIFHTLIFGLALFAGVFYINESAGFGLLVGYFLHLFLDCFTKSGVRIFWPLSNLRVGLGFFRSGGLREEIFFVLLLLGDLVLLGGLVWVWGF